MYLGPVMISMHRIACEHALQETYILVGLMSRCTTKVDSPKCAGIRACMIARRLPALGFVLEPLGEVQRN